MFLRVVFATLLAGSTEHASCQVWLQESPPAVNIPASTNQWSAVHGQVISILTEKNFSDVQLIVGLDEIQVMCPCNGRAIFSQGGHVRLSPTAYGMPLSLLVLSASPLEWLNPDDLVVFYPDGDHSFCEIERVSTRFSRKIR